MLEAAGAGTRGEFEHMAKWQRGTGWRTERGERQERRAGAAEDKETCKPDLAGLIPWTIQNRGTEGSSRRPGENEVELLNCKDGKASRGTRRRGCRSVRKAVGVRRTRSKECQEVNVLNLTRKAVGGRSTSSTRHTESPVGQSPNKRDMYRGRDDHQREQARCQTRLLLPESKNLLAESNDGRSPDIHDPT
jgi:hypothetical protein